MAKSSNWQPPEFKPASGSVIISETGEVCQLLGLYRAGDAIVSIDDAVVYYVPEGQWEPL